MKTLPILLITLFTSVTSTLAAEKGLLIVNMGDTQFLKIGTTIFDNRAFSYNLRSDFDAECAKSALNILGPAYSTSPELSKLWRDHEQDSNRSANDKNAFKADFAKELEERGFNKLVVIETFRSRDLLFGTNQWLPGYGLATRGFMLNENSIAYINVKVDSVDVSTIKAHSSKSVTFRRHLYETVWQDSFDSLPEGTVKELDTLLESFSIKAIPQAMFEAKIISTPENHVEYSPKPEESRAETNKERKARDKALFEASIKNKEKIGLGGMTCKKPYKLTQNCNIFNGAGLKVSLDDLTLRIAGSEDGNTVLVMPFKKINDTRASNHASNQVISHLENHNLFPEKVDVVTGLGYVQGYVLHYSADAFSILEVQSNNAN